jgi:protein-S-isoprenylcysteine O-methyltransferase Ste14
MPSHPLELRIPPPVVALLLAAAMWWLAAHGAGLPMPADASKGMMAIFLILGLTFDLAALAIFLSARTTINPLQARRTSVLVMHGVYRITRNPMYVGLAFNLSAWAMYLAAWLPLAGPLLFVAYISRFQIAPEERILARLFGDDYHDYTRRVRRWL